MWIHGLGLWEAGWLKNKNVIVQRGNTGEYVNLNLSACIIQDFEKFHNVPHPISTLVALYVLTGCDYVSSFFKQTKQKVIESFISNVKYILNDEALVTFDDDGRGQSI